MEEWRGVLLLILPTEGRDLGVAFAFFLEEKKISPIDCSL